MQDGAAAFPDSPGAKVISCTDLGMGTNFNLCAAVCALALAGCATQVSVNRHSEYEYRLGAIPPGGMFAFSAGDPSREALPNKAAEICPTGYDKLHEERLVMEGVSVFWDIRCHAAASAPTITCHPGGATEHTVTIVCPHMCDRPTTAPAGTAPYALWHHTCDAPAQP